MVAATGSTQPATLLKKETPTQVFYCEFCEISRKTFFTEHLRATASVDITMTFYYEFSTLDQRFDLLE